MAIGAYASAYVTSRSATDPGRARVLPRRGRDGALLLAGLRSAGRSPRSRGSSSAFRPSRLRGDYLAIVTLGFGEIIRVFILNIDAVGGARGLTGIPKLANFFWIYSSRQSRSSSCPGSSVLLRTDAHRDPGGRDRRGGDGRRTTRSKVISFIVSSAIAGIAGGSSATT
jgi:branched-chain amino acid transport system permease protein